MLTDERLDAIVRHVETTHSDFGHMVMVIAHVYEMRDEINRLRAQNDQLRAWLDEARSVIEAYQTPNVDNASFTWSEGAVAKAHREALEDGVKRDNQP